MKERLEAIATGQPAVEVEKTDLESISTISHASILLERESVSASQKLSLIPKSPVINSSALGSALPATPELAQIMLDEKAHFTQSRVIYALVAFVSVFTVQLLQQGTNLFDNYIYAIIVYAAYGLSVVL
jgi:hypothetical protein